MKKRLISLILALLLCFLAVACSPTSAPTNEDPPPNNSTPKEAYYFILYNSECLTNEDESALARLSGLYPTHDVFSLDVKNCESAEQVYDLLKEEAAKKTGRLDGIQIVGTASAVPAFPIDYKITLPTGYATNYAYFLSDYFYTDLTKESTAFSYFNVADSLDAGMGILSPMHPVIRLPLGEGELSDYLDNYAAYLSEYGGEEPVLTAMVSPIFRYDNRYEEPASADDLAYFLSRAEEEWNILEDARIYTNALGEQISPAASLGDIGAETLAAENAAGVREFFFSGHGDAYALYRTVFTANGGQNITGYIDLGSISEVLDDAPYFMDLHTCAAAEGMNENLVREAMRTGCLGAFATTSIISNNGIDSHASLADLTASPNFFGFHYSYLAARAEGASRTDAFFRAQSAFAMTLAKCAEGELDYSASYEFGYHNLLTYMNFGIFEPTAS